MRKADMLDFGGLSYTLRKVTFTKYDNEGIESGRFMGCYMAAFTFLTNPFFYPNDVFIESDSTFPYWFEEGASYIAHIFTDKQTDEYRFKFADLENKRIIRIEALFRPFDTFRDKEMHKDVKASGLDPVERGFLKRGVDGEWTAWIKTQAVVDVQDDFVVANFGERMNLDEKALKMETYYYKGLFGVRINQAELALLDQVYQASYQLGKNDREIGKYKKERTIHDE